MCKRKEFKLFQLLTIFDILLKKIRLGVRNSSFSTKQYITLVPHKSLINHDSQKNIFYHIFYLLVPICKRKEFKLFQLLENFKKKFANAPSSS